MKTIFVSILFLISNFLLAADYEGNWQMEKVIADGVENKDLAKATIDIDAKSIKISQNDFKISATYQLDKSKNPNQITIETDGEEKFKIYGIIRNVKAEENKKPIEKAEIVIDVKKFPSTFEISKLEEGNTYFLVKKK